MPFDVSSTVGLQGPNKRDDVRKVETLLGRHGYMDLKPTDGPTGYPGTRLVQGIQKFQKDKGLKRDGFLRPGGETIRALAAGEAAAPKPAGPKKPIFPASTAQKAGPPRPAQKRSLLDAAPTRRDGHDFDGVHFPSDRRKQAERLANLEHAVEQRRLADERMKKSTHDFEGVDFDQIEKKKGKQSNKRGKYEKDKNDVLNRLFESLDDFMKDPSNRPTETPPLDEPPKGPPPPVQVPSRTPLQRLPKKGGGRIGLILQILDAVIKEGKK